MTTQTKVNARPTKHHHLQVQDAQLADEADLKALEDLGKELKNRP
ncbi:MAG: hypothetical protein AB8G86_18400 [Saprospiraceae bacterium]